MIETVPEHTCKSCGNRFTGMYCNLCGEKILVPQERSFRSFLADIRGSVRITDNKFITTLGWIIRKPGFISREFSEGRTVRYFSLVSLFFVLNLIYFLFPVIQLFNASLKTQLQAVYGEWIRGVAAQAMLNMGLSDIDSFSILYNQKTTSLAKLLVMAFVVLASLPLNVLYRKRNRYFSDHVGFMVELVCFNLFVNAIVLTLLTTIFNLGHYLDEFTLTFIFVATNLYFLMRSGEVFYRERGWRLALKSVMMLLFLKVSLEVYRVILFFITLLAL